MDPAISQDTSFIVFTFLDMDACHDSGVWPCSVCVFMNNRFAFVAYSLRLAPHAASSQLVALCLVICLALFHICASSQAVYFAWCRPHTLNNLSPVLCMHFTFSIATYSVVVPHDLFYLRSESQIPLVTVQQLSFHSSFASVA